MSMLVMPAHIHQKLVLISSATLAGLLEMLETILESIILQRSSFMTVLLQLAPAKMSRWRRECIDMKALGHSGVTIGSAPMGLGGCSTLSVAREPWKGCRAPVLWVVRAVLWVVRMYGTAVKPPHACSAVQKLYHESS